MCGIIGIISNNSQEVASQVLGGLLTLQHRGQDAAGILSFDNTSHRFNIHKGLGLINNIFNDVNKIKKLKGNIAIGHTRYATTGSDDENDIQPLVTGFPHGIAMAHNGNIVNYHQLTHKLRVENQHQFLTTNDLELFLTLFSQCLSGSRANINDLKKASESIFENAIGAYSIVGILAEKGIFGLRDPNGIRPLVLGKKEINNKLEYILCSESNALNFLDFEYIRDIEPGEFIFITNEAEVFSFKTKKLEPKKSCMFEWVYFSNAESDIENRSVYQTRINLGLELAKEISPLIELNKIQPDIVSPVPDTSRSAAIAVSEYLNIPYRECLIKNRYVQRSFILKSDQERAKAIELKLSPIISEIKGKRILLIDDSLVRGTTAKRIISLLKSHGATEVTFALTCPPLKHGCFYGVDFPNETELIANNRNNEEIKEIINANELIYLTRKGLKKALKSSEICTACIDGKYPTDITSSNEFKEKRNINKILE